MKQGSAVAFSCDLETPVMRSWARHGEGAARGTLPGLHRKAANWDSDLCDLSFLLFRMVNSWPALGSAMGMKPTYKKMGESGKMTFFNPFQLQGHVIDPVSSPRTFRSSVNAY